MANKKITQLAAATSLANTDVFPVVQGIGGTPVTKKASLSLLGSSLPFYGCKVRRTSNQSIANNTIATVVFSEAVINSDSMWESGNPQRMVIKKDGVYLCRASASFSTHSSGYRTIMIIFNYGGYVGQVAMNPISGQPTMFETTGIYGFVTGTILEMKVYQNSGTSLNLLYNDYYSPVFDVFKIG